MKVFGLLCALVGIVLGGSSLFLDTTNGSGFNNVGLLFSKLEIITISACILLSGVILFCTALIIEELKGNRTIISNKEGVESIDGSPRSPGILEAKIKSFGDKLNDYQIK